MGRFRLPMLARQKEKNESEVMKYLKLVMASWFQRKSGYLAPPVLLCLLDSSWIDIRGAVIPGKLASSRTQSHLSTRGWFASYPLHLLLQLELVGHLHLKHASATPATASTTSETSSAERTTTSKERTTTSTNTTRTLFLAVTMASVGKSFANFNLPFESEISN